MKLSEMIIQSDTEAENAVRNGANLICHEIRAPSSCLVLYSNTSPVQLPVSWIECFYLYSTYTII